MSPENERVGTASTTGGAASAALETPPDDSPEAADAEPTSPSRSTRLAFWAFCAYLAVALVVLIFVVGRDRWFWADEWFFLSQLGIGDAFEPYNQHWSTLLIVVYQVLFRVFGLDTYLPFLSIVVVLHLTVAALLRVIMRRVGVGPWLATVAAGVLVFFGPGSQDILWAIQIGCDTALVLGLTQMLLADHDGPIDHRDWWGLAAGAVGLMAAADALPLIAATGIVALWRRGPRAAAFHTVPLGIAYAVWYVVAGASEVTDGRPGFTDLAHWGEEAMSEAFQGLGQHQPLAILLLIMLVAGLPLAWFGLTRRELATRAAIPVALLFALAVFVLSTGLNRFTLQGAAGAPGWRYVYVYAALLLPALAVAGAALMRRWRPLAPVVFALFLIPIPWQMKDFRHMSPSDGVYFASLKAETIDWANSPVVEEVPPWVRPDVSLLGLKGVTAGWLIEQRDNGNLPERPADVPPTNPDEIRLRFGAALTEEKRPDDVVCTAHQAPVILEPAVGDEIMASAVSLQLVDETDAPLMKPIDIYPQEKVISVQLPDLRIRVSGAGKGTSFVLCERPA